MPRKGIKKYKSLRAQISANNKLVDQFREMAVKNQHYESFIFDCYRTNKTIEITEKNYSVIPLVKMAGGQIIEFLDGVTNASKKHNIHVDSPAFHHIKRDIESDYQQRIMGETYRRQTLKPESMRNNLDYESDDNPFTNFKCT